jgi:tol-pal system protein YbgF
MEIKMKKLTFLKKSSPVNKTGGIFGLVLFFSLFFGCASKQSSKISDSEVELKLLDKRMSAVEEKIDKLYSRLSIIQFMVDNHEQMIKVSPVISQKTKNDEKTDNVSDQAEENKTTAEEYLSPQKLYAKGIEFLKKKNYQKAVEIFDEFLKKYPDETLADNALYWKGESFYAQSDYKRSAEIFELVTKTYPDGTKCPDALLKAGYSYLKLDDKEKAKELLQRVIKSYPFSNAAPKAQSKLKEIL